MELGCAGGDPYENIWCFNGIGVVCEDIHMQKYGFLWNWGCTGGDPYENTSFFNRIWGVWEEEIHMKIYGFPMELGLCGP